MTFRLHILFPKPFDFDESRASLVLVLSAHITSVLHEAELKLLKEDSRKKKTACPEVSEFVFQMRFDIVNI
jgi:hypothetical protein